MNKIIMYILITAFEYVLYAITTWVGLRLLAVLGAPEYVTGMNAYALGGLIFISFGLIKFAFK